MKKLVKIVLQAWTSKDRDAREKKRANLNFLKHVSPSLKVPERYENCLRVSTSFLSTNPSDRDWAMQEGTE